MISASGSWLAVLDVQQTGVLEFFGTAAGLPSSCTFSFGNCPRKSSSQPSFCWRISSKS